MLIKFLRLFGFVRSLEATIASYEKRLAEALVAKTIAEDRAADAINYSRELSDVVNELRVGREDDMRRWLDFMAVKAYGMSIFNQLPKPPETTGPIAIAPQKLLNSRSYRVEAQRSKAQDTLMEMLTDERAAG